MTSSTTPGPHNISEPERCDEVHPLRGRCGKPSGHLGAHSPREWGPASPLDAARVQGVRLNGSESPPHNIREAERERDTDSIGRVSERVPLWDAINAYVVACGGSESRISTARMTAVVAVERALDVMVERAICDQCHEPCVDFRHDDEGKTCVACLHEQRDRARDGYRTAVADLNREALALSHAQQAAESARRERDEWEDLARRQAARLEGAALFCVQCGAETPPTELDHWTRCEKHPARKVIADLDRHHIERFARETAARESAEARVRELEGALRRYANFPCAFPGSPCETAGGLGPPCNSCFARSALRKEEAK